MTRKKSIYLGLVALAGGGFIVDRVFTGQPEAASAETAAVPAKTKPPPAKPPEVKEADQVADPSLAWLAQLAEFQQARDAFTPSLGMLKHYRMLQDAEEEDTEPDGPQPGSPEAFAAEHELQATFVSKEALLAVVNGKLLRPGETISEFRLIKIEPYRAEFRRGRDRVTLSIPTPVAPE